jgi:hypothetical protein
MSDDEVAVAAEPPKQTIAESFTNVSAVSSSRVDAPSLLTTGTLLHFFIDVADSNANFSLLASR